MKMMESQEDFDFLGSLNENPSYYASSYGTTFKKYGRYEQGHTIAIGSLAFNPNGFAPGLYYLRAAGNGYNTLWLDLNQDANFELPSERIIAAGGNSDKIIFLGHQIPLIVSPGIENDRGLAISGKRSISSWEINENEPIIALSEYRLEQSEWYHAVMVMDRENKRLSTFLNGQMINTVSTSDNPTAEIKMNDWFLGGPGPFNSDQYFAGQIDDLRIYDNALSPEDIYSIYNGGNGDIGIVGKIYAPVVTEQETVTFRITFEKLWRNRRCKCLQDHRISNCIQFNQRLNCWW